MASTAAVSVKLALRNALQALPALEDVQVNYGYPVDDQVARERTWFGPVHDLSYSPSSLKAGKHFTDEVGGFEVLVEVLLPGATSEDTDTRAAYLSGQVIDTIGLNSTLGNDPTNGITGVVVVVEGAGEQVSGFTDEGSGSRFSIPVRWSARLT